MVNLYYSIDGTLLGIFVSYGIQSVGQLRTVLKVYRGDFLGTLALARALRTQRTENRKKKSGVFPRYISN